MLERYAAAMNNTLANGLTLLAHLASTAEAFSVTELAQHLDLPKSHVHRLLQTLVDQGYALQDDDRRYRVGLEPLVISSALLHHHPLRNIARPHLHALATDSGMNAIIAIPYRNSSGLVIAVSYPAGVPSDPAAAIGGRLFFPTTATGNLFAATVPGFANTSAMDPQVLAAIRQHDYALKSPAQDTPVNGIAVAIHDSNGNVTAALGCSAPGDYFRTHLDRTCDRMRQVATVLSAPLAHRPLA